MKKILVAVLPLLSLLVLPSTASAVFTVPQGGTGQTSFPVGACLLGNGTSALTSTYSPSFEFINATSTTATSTFSGSVLIKKELSVVPVGETEPILFADPTNHVVDLGRNDQGVHILNLHAPNLLGDTWMGASESFIFRDHGNTDDWTVLFGRNIGQVGFVSSAPGASSAILDFNSISSLSKTFTFPNSSGTFGLLETSQIWAGANTFSQGAIGTTTITIGQMGSSTSHSCFNTKNTDGDDISFYFVGTSMVVEPNTCN